MFDTQVLRSFGKYSYGIYVLHWPVYLSLNSFYSKYSSELAQFTPSTILILNMAAGIFFSICSRICELGISLKRNSSD